MTTTSRKAPATKRVRYTAVNGISPPGSRYEAGEDCSDLPKQILSYYVRTGDVRKERG